MRAEDWWADPAGAVHGTDLAVVMIAGDATAGREVEPARFGRISDGTAVLAVQAFGFPLFKLRGRPGRDRRAGGVPGSGAGDRACAGGGQPPSGHPGRVPGRPAARRRPEPGGPRRGQGMSGAAVWADGRIVAVVAEHHPGEGTGRLTARRIDRAYEQLSEL